MNEIMTFMKRYRPWGQKCIGGLWENVLFSNFGGQKFIGLWENVLFSTF